MKTGIRKTFIGSLKTGSGINKILYVLKITSGKPVTGDFLWRASCTLFFISYLLKNSD
jgi:hypothetical protein